MFVPFSRILTLLMFAVIAFVLLVPMALQRHNLGLAVVVTIAFAGYLAANVVLWRRYRSRG